jgi:hypothetical protein
MEGESGAFSEDIFDMDEAEGEDGKTAAGICRDNIWTTLYVTIYSFFLYP